MIIENNIGLVCPAENIDALFNTIENAINNNHSTICQNARSYAENFLSIDIVMHNFVKDVMKFND